MDNHKYLGWCSRLSKVNIRKKKPLAFAVFTVPSHFSHGFTENICMYEQVCICDWNFSIRNPCTHCAIIYLKMKICILLFKLMFFYYPRFRDSGVCCHGQCLCSAWDRAPYTLSNPKWATSPAPNTDYFLSQSSLYVCWNLHCNCSIVTLQHHKWSYSLTMAGAYTIHATDSGKFQMCLHSVRTNGTGLWCCGY